MKAISLRILCAGTFVVSSLHISAPAYSAPEAIKCRPTTATAHKPMKTNPPQKSAESLARKLTLKTNCGEIQIALDARAPFTVTQMSALAKAKYFDGSLCHRLAVSGFFMLQCGDPTATGLKGPGFRYPDENLPIGASLAYPAGTVAMANSGPNTNGSQFFLVFGDSPNLGPSYTIWGKITKGMDVLKAIGNGGVDSPTGVGKPNIKVAIERAIVK